MFAAGEYVVLKSGGIWQIERCAEGEYTLTRHGEKILTIREVADECENYKKTLERNHTKFKITDEQTQSDGSIIIKVKKQISGYDVGDYLD